MKVLLVQTSFLGDTILSTPLIAALKNKHPQAELWMLTTRESRALVEHDPLVAGVLVFDKRGTDRGIGGLRRKARELRGHDFAVAYSLHRSYRTALLLRLSGIPERIGFNLLRLAAFYTRRVERPAGGHEVERNLALLGADATGGDLRLTPAPLDQLPSERRELLESLVGCAVLAPGSVWETKRWSWREYRRVVSQLSTRGYRVVLVGAPAERAICDSVGEGLAALNLAGKLSLGELLNLVQRAGLVICNDSMVLHLASAFQVPTIAVFCATSPDYGFGPWRNSRALVVGRDDLSCRPCRRHGSRACPNGTRACMDALPAEFVMRAIEQLSRNSALGMQ